MFETAAAVRSLNRGIHPDDAAPLHITPGDEVRVSNARALFSPSRMSRSRQRGVVASTKAGAGYSKDGATINATVDERDSDMGGGAIFHDNRVRVKTS